MTRQEFIEQLRIALQGKISQGQLNEHLRYYDNYIMEESRKGQTESQAIEALGDPRLIAKTLCMTAPSPGEEADYRQVSKRRQDWRFHWNSWYGLVLVILIAVLILVIIGHILAFLLPIVIPVVIVLLIVSFLTKRRR